MWGRARSARTHIRCDAVGKRVNIRGKFDLEEMYGIEMRRRSASGHDSPAEVLSLRATL